MPVIPGFPEVLHSPRAAVNPGFRVLAILKPPIGTPDGHVENQVELLIKRGVGAAGLRPWINVPGAVPVREWEAPPLPKMLVEVGIQHLQQPRVDVREDVLLAPLEPECVVALRVCGM